MDRIARAYERAGHKIVDTRPSYTIGLDLGQAQDYTALGILRIEKYYLGRELPRESVRYYLERLERAPLGTGYPSIARHVKTLYDALRGLSEDVTLVVDATGVGRPVVDMFIEAGLKPYAVTFTGGHQVTIGDKPRAFRVPKKDLVASAVVALQNGTLSIAKSLKHAETLRKELSNFKVKISLAGSNTYEAWREGDHDDLVLAVCLALWKINYREDEPQGTVYGYINL